jgi:S1-C subfamily serine protease
MKSKNSFNLFFWIAVAVLGVGAIVSTGIIGRQFIKIPSAPVSAGTVRVESEESVVIHAVDTVSPAVVTVGITQSQPQQRSLFQVNPFDPFTPIPQPTGNPSANEEDIGSGFIVDGSGLIITNKHVVSDTTAKYRIITKDNKSYDVQKIYRDPANDLAIVKINTSNLPTVTMGDSDKIKVGQLAVAIGTALGEFRSTVTTGVISGVGRGITAGDPYAGAAERLDNVIQTSAAINPGNSGGPLVNSSGQVIGINVATSEAAQNIGFALPINVVKDAIKNFNSTGQFNRPYIGIRYKTITRDVAVLNDIPEGAYVFEVISGSPADGAGLKQGDIITKMDDTKLSGSTELSGVIAKKKVGDRTNLTVNRDGTTMNINVMLGNQSEQ